MVMQSHGGTIAAKNAGAKAVELLLSGPAGGLVGAQYQGNASGVPRMMSFDMGGTSTDVALIDGEIQLTSEAEIAGYPVAVSMVDMHTIGAGGGSIAWLDEGGMLQVGPQSAGADPGPACYGRGGHLPTVTDANLILGRLPMETSLGGHLALDFAAAQTAVAGLAREMGIETETAAAGILQVANELMAQALRVISVQRGHDPREFALLSFGGAGGLQVCELAERLGMKHAIVPLHGGVLSALGMLVAPVARQRSQTRIQILSADSMAGLEADFQRLENSLRTEMREEGAAEVQLERSVDLRYQGQSSTLSLPWLEHAEHLTEALHQRHQDQFGHALAMPVELVNLRVRAEVTSAPFHLPVEHAAHSARPLSTTSVFGIEQTVPVYARSGLSAQQRLNGPAIIAEEVSTTWLAPGWNAVNDTAGNLILRQA
ncbi:MAG TPA: hydantoinase/oxoprolinase family protein, partial [Gammaproteobacteria bacterium]|nr:hydantoinase/oxoprolinase family protein [Gammaproteobacteria bacterium]